MGNRVGWPGSSSGGPPSARANHTWAALNRRRPWSASCMPASVRACSRQAKTTTSASATLFPWSSTTRQPVSVASTRPTVMPRLTLTPGRCSTACHHRRGGFGSTRNPIWRHGGIVFGPRGNENYSKKLSKTSKYLYYILISYRQNHLEIRNCVLLFVFFRAIYRYFDSRKQ